MEATPTTQSGVATDPAPRTRVQALDALRGVAVMGIIPMNVLVWSMVPAGYFNPRADIVAGAGPLEVVLWTLTFVLVEDKFRTLFAVMVGAGIAILIDRARAREGAHPLREHYARMGVLMLIGVAHSLLLADNDILRSYAVAGCALPLFLRWPVRRLLWAVGILVALEMALTSVWAVMNLTTQDAEMRAAMESSFGAGIDMTPYLDRAREMFDERVVRRLGEGIKMVLGGLDGLRNNLACMVLGVALWRSGLLAGEWPRKRLLRLARRLALLALPVLVGLAAWTIASGFDAAVVASNAIAFSIPFDMALGTAYAALAMAVFASGGALTARLAAAGRMALSNYLMTSVIFAVLFRAWGLGLYLQVGRGVADALVLVPVAFILLWSPLWLARFRQGPAEWLWRSLAALRPMPLRR
ncbi:DUF418 domain-containing protein [Aurantiacibacter luteus]|uniref:DUF418 domain-containing protein n=1 Tax=Aurantiacibacter luteus TaxID=1581420 RepID=A0A0G9MZ10_9SPHN|nr:DUF418 domain-containing protein [Aurantiacibacter luteus]KLE34518.1 hypothetical protein AAW00_09900 [Aurantiacibacter luteus]